MAAKEEVLDRFKKKDEGQPEAPAMKEIDIALSDKQVAQLTQYQQMIADGQSRFETAVNSIIGGADIELPQGTQLLGVVEGKKSILGKKKMVLRLAVPK